MKTFTIQDIRSWSPCYDPSRYLPEDWLGTAVDLLKIEAIPLHDRFWVVLRTYCIDNKTLRLFAANCARRALARVPNPDPRSLVAIEVAERFADGLATEKKLVTAHAAADAAADYAAAYAAAARAAADYAAADAARAAARAAARGAYAYADAAAYAADAAHAAARGAYAARADAAAERQEQVKQLLLLLGETV